MRRRGVLDTGFATMTAESALFRRIGRGRRGGSGLAAVAFFSTICTAKIAPS